MFRGSLKKPVHEFEQCSLVNSDLLTRRGGYSSTFKLVGGEGGIRTHGTREGTPVFETGPFNHSGTPPH